jgi:hypothetical protein
MKAQPTRLDLVQGPGAQLCGIHGPAPVLKKNLHAFTPLSVVPRFDPAERHLNGPFRQSFISMSDYIAKSLVHGTRHGAAFGSGKSNDLGQLRHHASNDTEQARIAAQINLQHESALGQCSSLFTTPHGWAGETAGTLFPSRLPKQVHCTSIGIISRLSLYFTPCHSREPARRVSPHKPAQSGEFR